MTSVKTFPAEIKAAADDSGTFSATVSTFGNVDRQGDRVMPTAFDKTREEWIKSGQPIPIVWSHQWDDPFAHIGWVDPKDTFTDSKKFGFKNGHLDVFDNPVAAQVYKLMKLGRIKDMSFAYEVPEGGEERNPDDGAFEIKALNLFEVGPCLVGANGSAGVTGVKAESPWTVEAVRAFLKADAEDGAKAETDTSPWDGAAAMASCSSAADFRKIAFERDNDSDPNTAAHWALPHHKSPGAPYNEAGVTAALGALNGARGGAPDLKDQGAARSHLEAHKASSDAAKDEGKSVATVTVDVVPVVDEEALAKAQDLLAKAGRVLSKANEAKIRQASTLLGEVLSSLPEDSGQADGGKAEEVEQLETKSEEPEGAKDEESNSPLDLRVWLAASGV